MKRIYCVLVTYNGSRWLKRCLLGLAASKIPVHLIVIDNGSSDASVEMVQQLAPAAELIESEHNLGFGRANNLGIERALAAGADYIFLLNQDAWIQPDTLTVLLSVFSGEPSLGVLSPWHMDGTGQSKDLYFNRYLEEAKMDFPSQRSQHYPEVWQQCRFVNAAAWLISAECIKIVGGFAPIFRHYGEDVNFCQRVGHHGMKIGITSQAVIFHDRAERINHVQRPLTKEQEYIHFLIHACNLAQRRFRLFTLRRAGWHALQMLRAILHRDHPSFLSSSFLAKKTAMAMPMIARTRQLSRKANHPFLQIAG